jgi:DNA-directed RNA polymerase subunit RPC12/RpoP
MVVLRLVWFLVKWWFLIGATLMVIYLLLSYLRRKLNAYETWEHSAMLLFLWPITIWMSVASAWRDRRAIASQLLSADSTRQVAQHKTVAIVCVLAILAGLGMMVRSKGENGPPVPDRESYICASCNSTFEAKNDYEVGKDDPVRCPDCGKSAAWVKAFCPFCRATFPYSVLVKDKSSPELLKCPKCDKPLPAVQQ